MRSIKKIAIFFLLADLVLIVVSIFFARDWFISSQVAFFNSLLITFSSYLGYKNMIQKRLEAGDIPKDDRDEIDNIEDRHDLYSEDVDLKTVIKEERAKIGGLKKSAIALGKSASGALSVFRLLSYLVLFLSFLYLNRHGLLDISGYLIGLAVVPIVALLATLL